MEIRVLDSTGDSPICVTNLAEAQRIIDTARAQGRRIFKVLPNGTAEGPIGNAVELGEQNIAIPRIVGG